MLDVTYRYARRGGAKRKERNRLGSGSEGEDHGFCCCLLAAAVLVLEGGAGLVGKVQVGVWPGGI